MGLNSYTLNTSYESRSPVLLFGIILLLWSLELDCVYCCTPISSQPKYTRCLAWNRGYINTLIHVISLLFLFLFVSLPSVTRPCSLNHWKFKSEPCCILSTFLGCCKASCRHAAGSATDDERCPEMTRVKLDAHIQTYARENPLVISL